MPSPVELFIKLFWPRKEIRTKETAVRYRVLLYFCFFDLLVMLYSVIKWVKLDYDALVYTSAFGLVMALASGILIRLGAGPVLAANIFLCSTFPHGFNMILNLGGLDSSHVLWMPTLVCIAYLLTNRLSGFVWFIIAASSIMAVTMMTLNGHQFPNFAFTPEQLRIDRISGFLLPMIVIWLAQNYALLAKREAVARLYTEYLQSLSPSVRAPRVRPGVKTSWFVYVVTLADGLRREPVMRAMEAHGIPVRGYFSPMHLAPYIRQRFANCAPGSLPRTESLAARTFALPFHGNMTAAEVDRVVSVLADVLETEASK